MVYFLVLLFSVLGLGGIAKADSVQLAPTQKPMIAVSIAVPEERGQHIIALSTADPHIDVVIHNVSNQSLDFYAEDCSAGYDSLHLELLSIDDKALPKPIIVERSVMVWERNRIRTVTLEPGDVMVREIHFSKDTTVGGIPYLNFPPMKAGDLHKIQMRAVFTVGVGQPRSKVWSGSIASKTDEYQVVQYSP